MYDLAIKNGFIVDGSGSKPFKAHVYVKDGKIAEISSGEHTAEKIIEAGYLKVSPGFVDIHSHSDCSFQQLPTHEGKLSQGVTFELVGQCGMSLVPLNKKNMESTIKSLSSAMGVPFDGRAFPAQAYAGNSSHGFICDFAHYAAEVNRRGISVNLGALIGHGTLRSFLAGWELRDLSETEMEAMCRLLDDLLSQGAVGLSLGLIYPPGSFCDTKEIMALARTLARRDRLLAVHMRNENEGVFRAVDEIIGVARETGVRLQISHLKLMGESQWGRADELLAALEAARSEGIRVQCDQYPYTASSSPLTSCFPGWAMEGGYERFVRRLRDNEEWDKIRQTGFPELYKRGGPERTVITNTNGAQKDLEGLNLIEAADKLGLPLFEAMREMLILCGGTIGCIYHSINEGDMLKIMAQRDIAIASDGTAFANSVSYNKFHPRSTSTFPRFLRFVREKKLMPIEDAIRKISALPARFMGLEDKIGKLAPGFPADIAVFDEEKITDRADYQTPHLAPDGISHVIVNGKIAYKDNSPTVNRSGTFYLMR